MPWTESILRYPGGKSQLYPSVSSLIKSNQLGNHIYVEPFAGGAGLALKLLFNDIVPKIVINDFDPAIFALWHSCLYNSDEFIRRIQTVPLTVGEWDRQKAIYSDPSNHSSLDLGFSAFFLNRTNKSGIIDGGILGGREQTGTYKISARFNRDTLCKKICKIVKYKKRITLFNLDAKALISEIDNIIGQPVFFNIDPPYVKKGAELYHSYYTDNDHKLLSTTISLCSHPWIVTYDICDFVLGLYSNYHYSEISVHYSANKKRKANEYIFFSPQLCLPSDIVPYRK